MSKDNFANKIDRGVVHNWDVITKFIIDYTPYGMFIKFKEKRDEKHFKKRLPPELKREKVLMSRDIRRTTWKT